ncbi:MAG: hypothetical protein QXN37_00375 [Candidatus Anstonellaceae archaeon]
MQVEIRRSIISGRRPAPPSVAVAHRAIIAASFADGQSLVWPVFPSASLDATISICNQIGADIMVGDGVADIIGGGEIVPKDILDCAESNTTLKLFMGIFSHLPVEVRFVGKGKLLETNLRPFTYFIDYYSGYTFNPSSSLPLQLRGPIQNEEIKYPPLLGTQFLSGLILGAPLNPQTTGIAIDGTFKDPHCLHETIRIMKQAGIDFVADYDDLIVIQGGQGFLPLGDFEVPKNKKAASYLLLAGAVAGKCTVEGISDYPRLEAVLSHFGAVVKSEESSISASTSFLKGSDFDLSTAKELACHVLVLACLAEGQSRLLGFQKLPFHIQERLKRLKFELSKMGASIIEIPEGFLVEGATLHGADLDCSKDPNIAMSCAAAALCAQGPTTINNAEWAEKIFPGFFRELALLGAIIR